MPGLKRGVAIDAFGSDCLRFAGDRIFAESDLNHRFLIHACNLNEAVFGRPERVKRFPDPV